MKPTTLKAVLLVFVLMLSFAGCKKKDKVQPDSQPEPTPEEEVLETYTLDHYSGTPGDLIQLNTQAALASDTIHISIGGERVALYKINDTVAVFQLPVLPEGKATIDLAAIAGKPVSFTVSDYIPITNAETVKKKFIDSMDHFIQWADTLEDQSMLPTLKGLREIFISEYQKLSDKEKLQAAYVMQRLNEPDNIRRTADTIARMADSTQLSSGISRSGRDEFSDNRAKFLISVGIAIGSGVLGYKALHYTGRIPPTVVAIVAAGATILAIEGTITAYYYLTQMKKAKAEQVSFEIDEWKTERGVSLNRKALTPMIQSYLRTYDLVFLPDTKWNLQIPSLYRSLSKKNEGQAEFYNDIFEQVDKIWNFYNEVKNIVEYIRGWGTLIANTIPSLPDFAYPIPNEPKTETRMTPADEIGIENISNPNIKLKTKANEETLFLTATGTNIKGAKEFTFDIVYRFEELGIDNKVTIQAVYVASELSVTAIAAGDTAIAKVTGGVPPYTFKWSNGKKDSILYKLKPGEYTVTVTDALDKTATASVKIVPDCKNSNLQVTISQTGTTATATANGGSPLYTYIWSNGATDRSIGNLSPGKYTVTVTDANGCSSSAETTIEEDRPDDDDESDSDSEKNPLFADAAAVKTILSANSIDVSDTSWDSREVNAVYSVLSKNGCSIANNRVTKLELKEKGLVTIPDAIGGLTALTSLNLSGNQINNISDSIAKLKILTALNLSDNQLSHIPEGIGNLKEIWLLDLSKNKLSHIPDSICTITKLSSLYLSDNELSEIPQNIGRLTSLTSLHLHSNKITNLPYSIGNLNQLTSFSLDQNKLTNLPSSFGSLTKLTYLSLQENQLTSLPPSIGNLTKLTNFYLHQNQLSSLPKEIGNLNQLTAFTLYQNRLTAIPAEIGNLTQLTQLELHTNLLTSLPSTIGNLVNLKGIYLGHNRLSAIPSTIGNLTKVTYLSIIQNQLTTLPSTIGNLINLRNLYLHYNQLTSIPTAVGDLPNLKKLTLDYNRFNCLPQAIWDLHLSSAVTWLNGNRHKKPDGKYYGLCTYGDTNCEDIPCSEQ